MDRRDFLAATPFVFGLPLLGSGPQDKEPPASRPQQSKKDDPFAQALLALKKGDAPGIAIVVPGDAEARKQLANTLNDLLEESFARTAKSAALWMRAVFVCVPADRLVVKAGENVVLLDPQGQRVAGAAADWSNVEVAETLHALIDDYERAWRARTKRAKPEPGESELATLLAASNLWDAHLEPTRLALAGQCKFGSHLLWTWRNSENERTRERIDAMIQIAHVQGPVRLPYGVSERALPQDPNAGCGGPGSRVACGMAIVTRRSRFLLRFLGE